MVQNNFRINIDHLAWRKTRWLCDETSATLRLLYYDIMMSAL